MKRKIFIVITLFLLTGCSKSNDKFYLDNNYYGINDFIKIDENKVNELQKNKASYVLFTYNSYCTFQVPCDDIFLEYMKNNNIRFNSISYEDYLKTDLVKTVKYAPSVILINKGNIVAYLDAENDEDLNKYQDTLEFTNWINQYINLK